MQLNLQFCFTIELESMMNQTELCQAIFKPETEGKKCSPVLYCKIRNCWWETSSQRTRAHWRGQDNNLLFFFYTLATANLIRASALRGSLLGTHSLYRPPRGSYLNPFNFLTCTWMTLCMKILSLCCLQSNTTL